MKIEQIQKEGIKKLNEAHIEEPILKAKLLLANLLDKPKEYLVTHSTEILPDIIIQSYFEKIEKLKKRVPIEYILQHKEFMKLDFYINEDVLIPRSDTEILVETVIEIAKQNSKINILDLCTGSGAIAVSLAKYLPQSNVKGIDISSKAIEVATQNAKKNNVEVTFLKSDLYQNIQERNWDIIVSNPPYIESDVIACLEPEVQHEPLIALDGGKDGLNFYRRIIDKSNYYLNKNGWLVLEIGYQQAKEVTKLLELKNCFDKIDVKKDLGGNNRVVIARYACV